MKRFNRRTIIRLGVAASLAPFARLGAAVEGEKQLGIAMLGLGNYATTQLAPAIKNARNARLTGIVTGSPDKIPVWQKEHKIPNINAYNYNNFDTITEKIWLIQIEPSYGYSGQKGSTPDGPLNFQHVPQQQLQIGGQVDAILGGTPKPRFRRDGAPRHPRDPRHHGRCGEWNSP